MKIQLKIFTGIISAGLLLSACSSDSDDNTNETVEDGYKVEHIHGLAYTKNDSIYMASHEGMIQTKDQGENWFYTGNNDFDFMGFHVQSDGTMLTSGHPGPDSDLPNPLGLMESIDNGDNWESKSLLGEVDFHVLTSNDTNPNLLFGVIQMESGNYEPGIYKSINKGEKWEKIDSTGLPKDLHGIYSLVSLSNDENVLIAGTNEGVLRSDDGGKTWDSIDSTRLITALSTIPDTSDLISYSILENDAGIMISNDNGDNWEKLGLNLGQDAVAYIAIHPEKTEKLAVVTFENTLLISEDGGQNWETLMDKGTLKN
ncbi:F510_1955 family glycosylhydrolase [Robertmurraya massiliosenegalensis]|uniref:F510_1955 family glycosylhydrolase n=1 Tax=Robertmurraya massiliosenegalensis TaxID=1287657 RepID=UPI0002E746F3|nr:hypothetical protein [Robertmurraya massiliosenegalensis]